VKGPNSNIKSTNLPSFSILKEGKEITDMSNVVSIRVESELSKISSAEIILSDGDAAKQEFEVSSKDDLIPGNELEIKLGYYQQNETVFKGNIIKHGIRTSSNESSALTLELRHPVYKSSLQRKSKSFSEKKDSDIIDTILGEYGVDKSVDATLLEHKQMVQFNCSDWDFINTRSEANGMLFITKTDKIEVIKPKASSPEKFELQYGTNVYETDLEIDSRFSFEDYEGKAWNYADQEIESGSPNLPALKETGNLSASDLSGNSEMDKFIYSNGAALEQGELDEILNAKKIKSLLGKIRGIVKCEGTSEIEPGDTVKLSGLGDRFNGNAFVSGVMHEYSAGRWITTLQIGVETKRYINRYTDVNEFPAGGLLPAVSGLQIGKVSEIEDKDGEERILVKIPIVSNDEDAVWARVARLDAGNSRGSIFHPEIDDEVIIGFINDDPRQAIILGMLNSSKNPVPDELKAAESNPVKGFITRSNLQFLFDDEKKIITIKTEKGSVIIDDDGKEITITDDSNKNKIILNDSGVEIESGKDIKIGAKSNISIEGNKIDIKSKTSLNASGNSGASVKSNGATEIKGSLVNIN
jgi:Rhs element Vgr protein